MRQKMRLFIADDSSAIRERIVHLVSEVQNAEVVGEASDGAETIRRIPETNPDLVILDLKMPKGSGFDILPLIKSLSHPPLVMVLTNYATSLHRQTCLTLGADYFFDKSKEFEKAIEVIQTLTESYAHPKL
jgi:two-component system, NarL family, response regulator DevR